MKNPPLEENIAQAVEDIRKYLLQTPLTPEIYKELREYIATAVYYPNIFREARSPAFGMPGLERDLNLHLPNEIVAAVKKVLAVVDPGDLEED